MKSFYVASLERLMNISMNGRYYRREKIRADIPGDSLSQDDYSLPTTKTLCCVTLQGDGVECDGSSVTCHQILLDG